MKYPEFIKKEEVIGITALSDGNKKEVDFIRLDRAKDTFHHMGYHTRETRNVRCSVMGRSSDGRTRARELESLFADEQVTWIISAKGGDFLCEMLSHFNYQTANEHPTWIQGYSDNTGILFTLTTMCDMATIYGNHFNDFGMEIWHPSVTNNYRILTGEWMDQTSFDKYEDGFHDKITGLEGYVLESDVQWINCNEENEIIMEGRLIGGCLDVLLMLAGTRFDHVKQFIETYREDGILWYLESFDLSSEALIRGLWQLKESGWFQYAAGFCFGRPCMHRTDYGISYRDAVLTMLDDLSVPIILDADIGHKGPQFTIINGAMGRFRSSGGAGSLTMWKK